MPFQGIRGSQIDPLSLALSLRQQRLQEERDKEADRLARMKFLIQAQKDQTTLAKNEIDIEKGRFELEQARAGLYTKLGERDASIGPLLEAANSPSLSNTQRQTSANQAITQINRGIADRVRMGQSIDTAAHEVGGRAGAALSTAEVAELKEVERNFSKKVSDRIAKSAGDRDAALMLTRDRREIRKTISRMRRQGRDTTALEEDEKVLTQLIGNIGKDGQISVTNIPGSVIPTEIANLSGTQGTIDRIMGLAQDIDDGTILTGPRGFIANLGLRVQGIANEIVSDPNVSQEMKDAVLSAANSSGPVRIQVDEGKQLSLSIDQLALAWDFVKAKRESARFTLLELETILKQLNFTSPTKTRAEVKGILGKIAEEAYRARARSRTVLRAAGVDPAEFEGSLGLTPQDRGELSQITGGTGAAPTPPVSPQPAPQQGSGVTFDSLPAVPTEADILEAARNSARQSLQGPGAR